MIPLQRPLLPSSDRLLPYLKRIDETRWYSNSGPLVTEFEERIGSIMNCYVAATSSCTLGLAASLLAQPENVQRGIWTVPSWTFVATANAVRMTGQEVFLVDVGKTSGIVVSQFGAPIHDNVSIIDAAGAFDAYASGMCRVRKNAVVISTHATKTLSSGEGGLVLSTDKDFIEKVKIVINHGLNRKKEVNEAGLNGKMSEYHAAVGLASLDGWIEAREKWMSAETRYAKYLGAKAREYASSIYCMQVGSSVVPIIEKLSQRGIMSRQVWGRGVHNHPAYKYRFAKEMSETDRISDTTLFLPFAIDMTDDEMNFVAKAVRECV